MLLQTSTPVFGFDPADYADAFARDGFVTIKNGVSQEFVQKALASLAEFRAAQSADLEAWRFNKKKVQFLYEFDQSDGWPDDIYDHVAETCGLDRDRLTLCERHIKLYDEEADPSPPPHKDRLASKVAVGIPLIVSKDSKLVIYPDVDPGVNTLQSTAKWRDSLEPDELPEIVTAGREPIELDCQPGDVVMFLGSALLHERINAANCALLFLKFNDSGQDPIGEDPFTPLLESESRRRVERCQDVFDLTVSLSPKFEEVVRHYTRHNWEEILFANLWADKPFRISESEFVVLREAIDHVPVSGLALVTDDHDQLRRDVKRLLDKGALISIGSTTGY